MAVTAISTVLDLTNKATILKRDISSGWYQASEAMHLFPIRLIELRLQSEMYSSLLSKYGMENDSFIEPLLKQVIMLLEEEEVKVERLRDQCCMGMTARKLLFPHSVIIALDGVIAVYKSIPEHINARENAAQQFEKSSLGRPRLLPFSHDDKYVPLEKSVREVRAKLESESSRRFVVICGGTGQGKSSMARYLACLYQDGISTLCPAESVAEQASSSRNLPPKTFENGVIFLRCGTKVNIRSLLVQLWEDMGFHALPSSNNQKFIGDQNHLQEEENVLKELSKRLRNQKVLIVLDDVWDRTIVERLMVQGQRVKYLITTQVPSLRTDAIEIPISVPNMREANNIFANYVVGYDAKVISNDIQMEIDGIITESDFNPLVLANVATIIEAVSELSEWKSTRKYLADLQDGDVERPIILHGQSYNLTMGASMKMALNSFSSEEVTLLCLASLFESRPIPEVVFKILFKSMHSSLAKFPKYSKHLKSTNFIRVESEKSFWSSAPRRNWSMHTMRQKLICRIREQEIALMFTKLCELVENNNIVVILLALYGQEPWSNQAASKLGILKSKLEDDYFKGGRFLVPPVEPFVWLLNEEAQEELQQHSHQSGVQVLQTYLLSTEVYHISLSKLLEESRTFSAACEAFYMIHTLYSTSHTFKIQDMSINTLESLVQNLAINQTSDLQLCSLVTLDIMCQYLTENAIMIGSFPNAIERLVDLLQEVENPDVPMRAAWVLGFLSKDVVENAIKIGSLANTLERLVALLQEGINPLLQASAAWALGQLSETAVENAIKIASLPNVMERLVTFLQEGMSPQVQKDAAWALGKLSQDVVENAIKIGSIPNALERLVALMQEGNNPLLQACAAWALGQLSETAVENAIKIASLPNVMERLVTFLQEGMNPQVQKDAAWALGKLSQDVVENAIKIGSIPNALERLVALMQEGNNPLLQACAAWALGQLSETAVENAIKIASLPNVMERLVTLLQVGMSPQVHRDVAWALGKLSENVVENAIKIGSIPNALERLVALLQEGKNPEVSRWAAWALRQLSKSVVENATKIRSMPNVPIRF